jgi:hypothetical protein
LEFGFFEFETETDVANSKLTDRWHYGNPKWFRLWAIAGSSHYDYYCLAIGPVTPATDKAP